MQKKRVHLTITGQVQGVFFRSSLQDKAEAAGVNGWVRNCTDGSVEAVLQGEPSAVDEVVHWAHQGPPSARVQAVQETSEPFTGEMKGFNITR